MNNISSIEKGRPGRKRATFSLNAAATARIECGLTKKELAQASGVSIKTLDKAEEGEAISGPIAFKIYNALCRSYEDLGQTFPWRKEDFVKQG